MIKAYWKPVVLAFAAGIIGVLLTLGSIHVWQDHWTIHQDAARLDQVIGWINDVQKAQKK